MRTARLAPFPRNASGGQLPLSERQYRAVLDLVGEAHDAQDLDEFRAALLPSLRRLVPADYASYNEVPADGGAPVTIADPVLPAEMMEAWERHALTNPLITRFMRTRDARPWRFSDVIGADELARLPLYQELYRPLGVRHQIAFALPSRSTLTIGIALSRGGRRDFADAERQMLDLARPHLTQAYRNAQLRARLDGSLDALRTASEVRGLALFRIDRSGVVVEASERALALAERAGAGGVGEPLPEAFAGAGGAGAIDGEVLLSARVPLGDGTAAVVVEAASTALAPGALEALGLSAREAQVLSLLARGHDTAAAAAELGLSPRTVHKHAQHIHAKLGVRDRAQAVATAWAATTAGPAGVRADA